MRIQTRAAEAIQGRTYEEYYECFLSILEDLQKFLGDRITEKLPKDVTLNSLVVINSNTHYEDSITYSSMIRRPQLGINLYVAGASGLASKLFDIRNLVRKSLADCLRELYNKYDYDEYIIYEVFFEITDVTTKRILSYSNTSEYKEISFSLPYGSKHITQTETLPIKLVTALEKLQGGINYFSVSRKFNEDLINLGLFSSRIILPSGLPLTGLFKIVTGGLSIPLFIFAFYVIDFKDTSLFEDIMDEVHRFLIHFFEKEGVTKGEFQLKFAFHYLDDSNKGCDIKKMTNDDYYNCKLACSKYTKYLKL